MFRKALLTLSTSAMLGAALVAPTAALAFLPSVPVLPSGLGGGSAPAGGPPGLPGGGPAGLPAPRGPPGPGGAGLPHPPSARGGRPGIHGGQGNSYGRFSGYAYGYDRSGYPHDRSPWRYRYEPPYGVFVYSNGSDASSCSYEQSYRLRAYRRVRTCSEE